MLLGAGVAGETRGRRISRGELHYVKSTNGVGPSNSKDVKLMRKTVGPDMGVKAAGGIRDRETALAMIEAGADRIGTSAGVKLL